MRSSSISRSWVSITVLSEAIGLLLLSIAGTPLKLSAQQSATPTIDQPLVPTSAAPGGVGFTLTLNGSGFAPGAVVKWNGNSRTTQFVSAAQLTAAILGSDIANVGTASISVVNPAPGGGASNIVQFPIAYPRSPITFTRNDYAAANAPYALVSADLNRDGAMDLVVANEGSNTVSVLLGDGHGSFGPRSDYSTGLTPYDVAVGDFNGDGILDLAIANSNCAFAAATCSSPVLNGSISILLGNGDGTFRPHVDYTAGPWTTGVVVGDFNGDGKIDLVAVNGTCPGVPCSTTTSSVSVLLGNGDGTFQPHVDYIVGLRPVHAVVGDFNGDGKLDVATANDFACTVSILLGNGDGTFQSQRTVQVGPPPAADGDGVRPAGIAAADLNHDGRLDLAVASELGDILSVFLGNGDGTFQPEVDYTTEQEPHLIAFGDFNGDGILDIVVTNTYSNGTISLFFGNGDGTFQPQVPYPTAAQPGGIVSADFNGDGQLDVAVAAQGVNAALDGSITVLLENATVTVTAFLTSSLNPSTYGQTVTFTATLAGNSASPTGSVNFFDGTIVIGTAPLTPSGPGLSSTATLTTSTLAVGTHPITVSYTATQNFGPATSPTLIQVVDPASQTISFTPPSSPVTYGAPPILLTASATSGLSVTFSVISGPGSISGNTVIVTGAGTIVIAANQPGDSNYLAAPQVTQSIVVNKATSVITWPPPALITYPTPLSATQFNATANTPGTFVYSPPAGTVLNAGTQTLSVTFTPTDTTDYTTATDTVQLMVNKAMSVITWANPAPITYGTPLSAAQLNATANTPGTFVYGPPAGAVLNPGTQTLSVTFTPTDTIDYTTATDTVQLIVKITTSTILSSSGNPSIVGSAVTFTATVSTGSLIPIPTGTVTFLDGATTLGTSTLNASGVATFSTSSLALGSHTITASASGDSVTGPSVSAPLIQIVEQVGAINFTIKVTPTPVTIGVGRPANLTVTANAQNGFTEPITLACSNLPWEGACTFEATTIAANGGTTTLLLSSMAPHNCDATQPYFLGYSVGGHNSALLALPVLAGLAVMFIPRPRRWMGGFLAILAAAVIMQIAGCGTCTDLGTPANTYTVKVTGTATGAIPGVASQSVVFTVTVP